MTTFLSRKPDSGLGNIKASPAAPTRNIDWVLMTAQMLLTVIGCFIVFATSRRRLVDDPYGFVTRQVVFAIAATLVMVVVMSADYEFWKDRARSMYLITVLSLVLLFGVAVATQRDQITFDLGPINIQPAEFAKFTTLLMLAAFLAEERSDEVS
jgi:cell division protein FtsW (lipid II flippase)